MVTTVVINGKFFNILSGLSMELDMTIANEQSNTSNLHVEIPQKITQPFIGFSSDVGTLIFDFIYLDI